MLKRVIRIELDWLCIPLLPGKEFEEQVLLDLLRDINVTYRFLPEELARI